LLKDVKDVFGVTLLFGDSFVVSHQVSYGE
jgi:hypothetical protein